MCRCHLKPPTQLVFCYCVFVRFSSRAVQKMCCFFLGCAGKLAIARAAVLALALPAPVVVVRSSCRSPCARPSGAGAGPVARAAVLALVLLAPVIALRRWCTCTWGFFRGLPALTTTKPVVLVGCTGGIEGPGRLHAQGACALLACFGATFELESLS
jgi:hypothetical protein